MLKDMYYPLKSKDEQQELLLRWVIETKIFGNKNPGMWPAPKQESKAFGKQVKVYVSWMSTVVC